MSFLARTDPRLDIRRGYCEAMFAALEVGMVDLVSVCHWIGLELCDLGEGWIHGSRVIYTPGNK